MSDNRCLFCDAQIPEGRMICKICEKHYSGDEQMLKEMVKSKKAYNLFDKINDFIDNWLIPVGVIALLIYIIMNLKS